MWSSFALFHLFRNGVCGSATSPALQDVDVLATYRPFAFDASFDPVRLHRRFGAPAVAAGAAATVALCGDLCALKASMASPKSPNNV